MYVGENKVRHQRRGGSWEWSSLADHHAGMEILEQLPLIISDVQEMETSYMREKKKSAHRHESTILECPIPTHRIDTETRD
jgi:hypothetical protein